MSKEFSNSEIIPDLVSIIIPVYNAEAFIEKAVNSALSQTYSKLEVVLVDDGSSDNSGKICDNFALNDSRVKVIHSENGGPSSARNIGLKHASGKYIMFMDSDDYVDSDMVTEMVKAAADNDADIVTVNFRALRINPDESVTVTENVMSIVDEIKTFDKSPLPEIYKNFGKHQVSIFVWNNLYRADLIQKYALSFISTKEVWSEDQLFNLCYYTFVKKAVYINKSFYNYGVRVGTFSHRKTPIEIIDRRLTFARRLEQFISEKGLERQSKSFYYTIAWDYFTDSCLSVSDKERVLDGIKLISKENKSFYKRCLLNLLFGKSGLDYAKKYSLSTKQNLYFRFMVLLLLLNKNERPVETYLVSDNS